MAALRLSSAAGGPDAEVPEAPVWVSIPGSVLQSESGLPSETRAFARSMSHADSAVLSFVPDGARFAAKLSVRCRNSADAAELATELTRTTTLLRQMFERDQRAAGAAGLSAMLSSGAFRSDGVRVLGYWPVERGFVESLLRGQG